MAISYKISMLAQENGLIESLRTALSAHFEVAALESAPNLTDLLELHIKSHYDLCFLDDSLPQEHLGIFVKDYARLERGEACVFVQLRDQVGPEFDRTSLRELGFNTVVSRQINAADVIALQHALKLRGKWVEIHNRISNVEQAVALLIAHVDQISEEKRRGRTGRHKNVSAEYISKATTFDDQVLQGYYHKLLEELDKLKAPVIQSIEIPESILQLNLPELSKDSYTGASNRVWKKLKKLFAKEAAKDTKQDESPNS